MLWTWSQEKDRNIIKIIVLIFHHSIQHDGVSGYTFYNWIDYPNSCIEMNVIKDIWKSNIIQMMIYLWKH